MARLRVPREKLRRTPKACGRCRRRKTKCDGLQPCRLCIKKHMCSSCEYDRDIPLDTDKDDAPDSPSKRRQIDVDTELEDLIKLASNSENHQDEEGQQKDFVLDSSTTSDDKTRIFGQSRMLEYPSGRLVYIGDSATLSFLPLIRTLVEREAGPSEFTRDPSRHKILEATIADPQTHGLPCVLPEQETAHVLVQSYFTHAQGWIQILDSKIFHQKLESYFKKPLSVKSCDFCLVFLAMAIGLVMATPPPNSAEEVIVRRLRREPVDHAELFFKTAKDLRNQTSEFEDDGDVWSIQALALMSVYLLAVSKRDAAYRCCGTAISSAQAMGLHRIQEMSVKLPKEELSERINLWRSLIVLDRFLAASLGRPMAHTEDDCTEDDLQTLISSRSSKESPTKPTPMRHAFDATVQGCQIIGKILRELYSEKRKISANRAQQLAEECLSWRRDIHPVLNSRLLYNGDATPAEGTAILHVQLLGHYATILLTQRFFFYQAIKKQQSRDPNNNEVNRPYPQLDKFTVGCVSAASRSIDLVKAAFEAHYLPQRNPFVLHFLFTAALVVLSNIFVGLHPRPGSESSIKDAIDIVAYCAEADVQAKRLLFILKSFRDAIQAHPRCSIPSQSLESGHAIDFVNEGEPKHRHDLPAPPQQFKEKATAAIAPVSQAPMNPRLNPPSNIFVSSEPTVSSALLSPIGSQTPLSQTMPEIPARQGNESAGTDSLGDDQELEFYNRLWDFAQPVATDPHIQQSPMQPVPPMHHHGGPGGMAYQAYPTFAVPQSQVPGIVIDPNVAFYQPERGYQPEEEFHLKQEDRP